MSKNQFDVVFSEVVAGLKEFHTALVYPAVVAHLKEAVLPLYQETGNSQDDYQKLRDAVEMKIGEPECDVLRPKKAPTMHLIIAQGNLCQWWQDEQGIGEWRDVEHSEYSFPNPPTL